MHLIVLFALGALGWIILGRLNEQFCLSVRNGRVIVVRGRVPPSFLTDVREVVKASPRVARATIRGVREATRTRLVFSGLDERRAQRLINIFSLCPQSKLRAAQPIAEPTLGQVLGIAWLAWLLDRNLRA